MKKAFSYMLGAIFTFSMLFNVAFAAQSTGFSTDLDVSGVKATALNAAAKVEWSAVSGYSGTVSGYKVYYGTTAVTQNGQNFDKNVDAGNVTSFVVTGLTNDTPYYFSVIAYDDNGTESKNWSTPNTVSTTPKADAGDYKDTVAPKVVKAEALDKNEIRVTFSEAVVLPDTNPEMAFIIDDTDTFEPLEIKDAVLDPADKDNKTVILTTADQKKGTIYEIQVTIDVQDLAGNPIISGTSDTAEVTGTDQVKGSEDKVAPTVVKVEAVDNTHFAVHFSEAIVLSIDPSENFVITEKDDDTKTLPVLGVELGKNDTGVEDASAIIKTSEQTEVTYMVTVVDVADAAANVIDPKNNSGTFDGTTVAAEVDITPPLDVANFIAKQVLEAEKYVVTLSWDIPEENIGDTVEQLIYESTDGENGDYKKEAGLGGDVTQYEMKDMSPGEYWFKITQKDAAGNESEGKTVKVFLAETGPEMGALVLLSLALGRVFGKKRK